MKPSPLVVVIVVPTASPTTTTAKPTATVSFAPRRAATRSAGTAPTISPAMTGRSRKPEPCGSRPLMAWKYCGRTNRTPNSPKTPNAVRTIPQVKLRDPNSDRSTSGCPPG